MAKNELVYTVNTVAAWIEGNVLQVDARGATRTGGWTNPELVDIGSKGDERVFEFVAVPPDGPSTDAITPIQATYRSGPLLPPFPRSVRVIAETNEATVPVGKEASTGSPYSPPSGGPEASA